MFRTNPKTKLGSSERVPQSDGQLTYIHMILHPLLYVYHDMKSRENILHMHDAESDVYVFSV